MALSEAVAHLPTLEGLGNVTGVRFPRELATNSGKLINQREANPRKKGDALARRQELGGHGFENWCWPSIVLTSYVNEYLQGHLI